MSLAGGVESFLWGGASGFWPLVFRAAPVGAWGSRRGGQPMEQHPSGTWKSGVAMPAWSLPVFKWKVNGGLTSKCWELPKGLHHSTTHKHFIQTFPDFSRTSQLSSPLHLDRQQHLGLVSTFCEKHFLRCCWVQRQETEAISRVTEHSRDTLGHPAPTLSPGYVNVNTKELWGRRGSSPLSLTIVISESSLKIIRGEQTTGSF